VIEKVTGQPYADYVRATVLTSWVCGLLAAHQWMVGTFPAQAQREVWWSNPDATFCGSYAPVNEAVAEGAGFRLSGRWGFPTDQIGSNRIGARSSMSIVS
jgi:hypothetical protein